MGYEITFKGEKAFVVLDYVCANGSILEDIMDELEECKWVGDVVFVHKDGSTGKCYFDGNEMQVK